MHALVIGATGATGKDLLKLLLDDGSFERVDIFVRRPVRLENPKLTVHVIDFDRPEKWQNLVRGDVLFSCLGTTLKAAGSKEAQWRIDHNYQYEFAKAARANHVNTCILVSALQASAKSNIFYSRMKGVLEKDTTALGFPKLIIFRPSLLLRKESDRRGEVIAAKIVKALNAIGMLRKHRPMPTALLAKAMIYTSKALYDGNYVVEGQDIRKYG